LLELAQSATHIKTLEDEMQLPREATKNAKKVKDLDKTKLKATSDQFLKEKKEVATRIAHLMQEK